MTNNPKALKEMAEAIMADLSSSNLKAALDEIDRHRKHNCCPDLDEIDETVLRHVGPRAAMHYIMQYYLAEAQRKSFAPQPCPENKESNIRNYRLILIEMLGGKCALCGSLERLEIDHVDGNPRNRVPSNLRVLCRSHHQLRHVGENTPSIFPKFLPPVGGKS
jgi:5-methylcytosine-specific restriction endonuclease McrA